MANSEIIGLIPAAGEAKRLGPLPCSKELFPIGFGRSDQGRDERPKVVSQHLLESMKMAGISKAYIVLRNGKWDIPAYFGDGSGVGMHLSYLLMRLPFGVPYTLDQAYPFLRGARIAMGFPDILFSPRDAFVRTTERQAASNADVILGLFPASSPEKMDLVDIDRDGNIRSIEIKPRQTTLSYTWIIAVWTMHFTDFMHSYVDQRVKEILETKGPGANVNSADFSEVFMSEVILAAMKSGMEIKGLTFPMGKCLDIGTPEDLQIACKSEDLLI
jgi:glucose-1-phosphate thymidylyltransferase